MSENGENVGQCFQKPKMTSLNDLFGPKDDQFTVIEKEGNKPKISHLRSCNHRIELFSFLTLCKYLNRLSK